MYLSLMRHSPSVVPCKYLKFCSNSRFGAWNLVWIFLYPYYTAVPAMETFCAKAQIQCACCLHQILFLRRFNLVQLCLWRLNPFDFFRSTYLSYSIDCYCLGLFQIMSFLTFRLIRSHASMYQAFYQSQRLNLKRIDRILLHNYQIRF